MSVAYLVLAHRAPRQLARLSDRLCGPGDSLFLHVDRNSELAPFSAALAGRENVHLARRRLRSRWGSFALVEATLALLEQALEECPFSHLCLLSGDSYPLVPPSVLGEFFRRAGERSFMFHQDGSQLQRPDRSENAVWYWSGDLRRVTYRHYQLGGRQLHLPNRFAPWVPRLTPPRDLAFHHGSQWWALSRRAARLAVETFIRRPALRRYFRRVQAPDEWAFQMVLANSPLAPTIVNDDLHFIRWEQWHATALSSEQLPRIAQAPKLFARKLDPDDSALADALDGLIAGREREPEPVLERLSARLLAGG